MLKDSRVSQLSVRIAGVMYLMIIAAGGFAEFVRESFVVHGNAAATANNIRNQAFLFRLGIAADVSTFILAIALTVILYVLLKSVSRTGAVLMLTFSLVQDAIGGLNALNTYRPLQLLGDAAYLKVFSPGQLEAMAVLSLNTQSIGFAIALLFFGCSCLALGYLVFKSGFFPKTLGVLIVIAGVCYLANSAATILSPPLESLLFPAILVPAFVGELSFAVWLTVKGVNAAS